jgi:hypothetical protein
MQKDHVCSRQDNLVIQQFEAELVVYDLNINKAYCLNRTSALVWQLCDGRKSVAEISDIMSKKLKTLVPEELVWLAIEQLKRDDLLKNVEDLKIEFGGLSRREAIRKVGLASMVALPLISSVIAPPAIAAASGVTCVPGTCYPPVTNICTVCGQCADIRIFASKDGTCQGSAFLLQLRCPTTFTFDSDIQLIRSPCV